VDDHRYQLFVSSTFLDLQEERAAVVSALLQMDAFPAGMELFPAADDDAWTLIKRVIDASDYYLLVVGGKYGSVDPKTELSYTEREYDYAIEKGKPVMAFLHAHPEKIEFGKSEAKQRRSREACSVPDESRDKQAREVLGRQGRFGWESRTQLCQLSGHVSGGGLGSWRCRNVE
jgi:Domain of unknown function (DUF4062)